MRLTIKVFKVAVSCVKSIKYAAKTHQRMELDQKKGYNALGNIALRQDHAVFSLNPKLYPIDIIYSAAYIMLDKAFILFDGDPNEKIVVEIRRKNPDQNVEALVIEFNEQLLNYGVYKIQTERNKNLREMIMHKVMSTPTVPAMPLIIEDPRYSKAKQHTEDPEGIMIVRKTAPTPNDPNTPSQ